MAESKYFGRKYKLTIGEKKFLSKKEGASLDIKFDVSYAIGQTARFGTVSILGLSFETMSEFTQLAADPVGVALSKMLPVKLEVGYESSGQLTTVIDGYAYYGTISSPPEMWLMLKVSEVNPLGGVSVNVNIKEAKTIGAMVGFALGQFSDEENGEGIEFDLLDCTGEELLSKPANKTFSSKEAISLPDFIKKLNEQADWGVVFLLRGHILEAHKKSREQTFDETLYVDKDHGLLSVSGIDAVSGDITTFIDAGEIEKGLCYLELKSDLNQQANGRYRIISIRLVGHFNGTEWYAKYHCSARTEE